MRMRFRILLSTLLVVAAIACIPGSASAASIAPPAHAWLDGASPSTAVLRWTPVRGATAYQLRRNGRVIARVRATRITLRRLPAASYLQYQVAAVGRGGARSRPGDPIPVVTRAPLACTHHVSTRGSDAGTGSASSPWRTIERLVDAWQPGWVGCLEGRFVEDVSIHRGGLPGAKVVLRERPGASASIRGRIWVSRGADDVVVANLHLDGRANEGAGAGDLPSPTVNGNGAMFISNDIHNANTRVCMVLGSIRGWGTTSRTTIAYNRIHDCGRRGVNTHHGIYVESGRSVRIVHNVIHDNADRGIQLYPDARNTLVSGNLFDGNGTGIIFSGAEGYASSGNLILRNVVANSEIRNNIEHWWEEPARPGTGNRAVRNCLGGARQGNFALPIAGYSARANVTGVLRYRSRAAGDFRPLATSGCRWFLRSRALPLRPMG